MCAISSPLYRVIYNSSSFLFLFCYPKKEILIVGWNNTPVYISFGQRSPSFPPQIKCCRFFHKTFKKYIHSIIFCLWTSMHNLMSTKIHYSSLLLLLPDLYVENIHFWQVNFAPFFNFWNNSFSLSPSRFDHGSFFRLSSYIIWEARGCLTNLKISCKTVINLSYVKKAN